MSKTVRLMVYDSNPGDGSLGQQFLKLSWVLGGFFFKLFGSVDDYKGFKSWDEAFRWLGSFGVGTIQEIQFWGHGSPGTVWLGADHLGKATFIQPHALRQKLTPDALFWFRSCSVFRGSEGREFAKAVVDSLGCKVAGHVRMVGPLQPALRTLKPGQEINWPKDPNEVGWATWDDRTVPCIASSFPDRW